MKALLIGIGGILLAVLAFVVLRGFFHGAQYAAAAAAGSARSGSSGFSIGGTGPTAYGPYTVHGIAIIDTSQGIPAVPYIEYLNANSASSTKQLVYVDERPCAPGAGDFPCAPTISAAQGYPELTTGEPITVKGYIYENRFLVTSLTTGS